jgi:beta-lactamase regulating signal transducer with metallopeptidase domain
MLDWPAGNVLAWMEQAFLLASVGSLLPIAFRIAHPWTKLAYCHALLAVCLLLPWMQPWRHPAMANGGSAHWAAIPEGRLTLWLLLAGGAAKLVWLLAGLWRIRKYRISSMPIYPIPESVRAASAVTHADALFCVSSDVPSPVMLGWLTPVVLLPETFLALAEEAQCGIACHELLHVRRHDWLVTVLEELAGTLLWFNPAVWPLLAQTRLAREQLVDAEVVRLTASREPYIDALLAIATGGPGLDLAPAPLFLRRRHLTQRVHSLLKDTGMSRLRLVSSYASIAAVLALAGWFGVTSFPLIGQPMPQQAAPRESSPLVRAEQSTTPAVVSPAAEARAHILQPEPANRALPANAVLLDPNYVPSAPVPPDLHELATGAVRPLTSPSDRVAALAMLERAKQTAKLHTAGTPPFRFDVSFVAGGPVQHTGPGQLTEIRTSGQSWRWTANLDGYSVVRVASGGRTMEEEHVSMFPMRVQTLREAILWTLPASPSNAQIRAAAVQWDGRPATCLLISNMTGQATLTQGRLWEEEEYCIDNASGLLQIYSIAPGTYNIYGYSRNLQFHGELFADRITIFTAGVVATDADFTIADITPADEGLLTPTPQMLASGPVITAGLNTRFQIRTTNPLPSKLVQPVIVHAGIGGDGGVLEEEVSAASDPALAQAALDLVKHVNLPYVPLTQRQAYINVRFMPR